MLIKSIEEKKKRLFYLQFIGLIAWSIDLYLYVPSAMDMKLLSVLFTILGIIFIVFHLTVIRDIYNQKRYMKKGDIYEGPVRSD